MTVSHRKTGKTGKTSHHVAPVLTGRTVPRNSKMEHVLVQGARLRTVSTRDAKNRLSAIIRDAKSGEVVITSDDEPAAVIMSVSRYSRLAQQQLRLVEFFQTSPLVDEELRIERSRDLGRDVDLS